MTVDDVVREMVEEQCPELPCAIGKYVLHPNLDNKAKVLEQMKYLETYIPEAYIPYMEHFDKIVQCVNVEYGHTLG